MYIFSTRSGSVKISASYGGERRAVLCLTAVNAWVARLIFGDSEKISRRMSRRDTVS